MSERAKDRRDLAQGRVPPNIKITKRSQFARATGTAARARVAPGEGISDPRRPAARRRSRRGRRRPRARWGRCRACRARAAICRRSSSSNTVRRRRRREPAIRLDLGIELARRPSRHSPAPAGCAAGLRRGRWRAGCRSSRSAPRCRRRRASPPRCSRSECSTKPRAGFDRAAEMHRRVALEPRGVDAELLSSSGNVSELDQLVDDQPHRAVLRCGRT